MQYDITIIGAGIVGLATALKIKEFNPAVRVCVLEKEKDIALHQTGNNSGVIHAGVYYKPGSLKALNCRKGYKMLVDFCRKHEIKFDLCGKLIVATTGEELPRLESLYERCLENGLSEVKKIPGEAIKEYEPYGTGLAAIFVPYTGIVDFSEISRYYLKLFQEWGGDVLLERKVKGIEHKESYSEVITEKEVLTTGLVVNTAGLHADRIARLTNSRLNVRIIPFRGEYYELDPSRAHLVKGLIYPVPDPAFPFLGVHFTRKINGGVEAGPNAVFAFSREGYGKFSVSPRDLYESLTWKGFHIVMKKYWRTGVGEYYRSYNKTAFTNALRRLLPSLEKKDLRPGGSGVRAQACDKYGGLIDDFLIMESKRQLDILNAPSPAATASLAIAETISGKALKHIGKKMIKQHNVIN